MEELFPQATPLPATTAARECSVVEQHPAPWSLLERRHEKPFKYLPSPRFGEHCRRRPGMSAAKYAVLGGYVGCILRSAVGAAGQILHDSWPWPAGRMAFPPQIVSRAQIRSDDS